MNLNWKKSVADDRDLDRQLAAPGQIEIARLVRELPEDMPSMAWRSDLNEKLRMEAGKIRRKRTLTNWVFRPALGLGVASLAAIMMFSANLQPVSAPHASKSADVADAIVRTYSDDLQNREVTYTPVSLETTQPSISQESSTDPYAEDITDSI